MYVKMCLVPDRTKIGNSLWILWISLFIFRVAIAIEGLIELDLCSIIHFKFLK